MLTTTCIAIMCVATVVMGGYIERKMREARNARHTYCNKMMNQAEDCYECIKAAMIDFHKRSMEQSQQSITMTQGKMDVLVGIYRDILKQHATNTPYPIRLTGGHINEDFAIIARIIHWNVQWREDGNVNLMPSSFVKCPHDLPAPVTPSEWDKLVSRFYEESGITLAKPNDADDDGYAEILNIDNIGKDQLCSTPVCVNPDLRYQGKETKCHYCNGICCNCDNCKHYRSFFRIRTALINTGKVNNWDFLDERLIRQIQTTDTLIRNDQTTRRIMKVLYEKVKADNPDLPESMDQLTGGHSIRKNLKKIATRMMEGPIIKLITSDEKLNKMTDELTNEVLQFFLEHHGIRDERTTKLMKWVVQQYHKKKKKRSKKKLKEGVVLQSGLTATQL